MVILIVVAIVIVLAIVIVVVRGAVIRLLIMRISKRGLDPGEQPMANQLMMMQMRGSELVFTS